tara:strand:- start:416 stop:697 length:282 start_codon:yes stop_codon:yes gene_type:complete
MTTRNISTVSILNALVASPDLISKKIDSDSAGRKHYEATLKTGRTVATYVICRELRSLTVLVETSSADAYELEHVDAMTGARALAFAAKELSL